MSIEDMSQQTITIESPIVASGSMGGESRTWTARSGLSGVPASIQAQAGSLSSEFARRGIQITHAIYSDTDLSASRIGDRVTDQDGTKYVVKFAKDMGAQGRAWSLMVEQII